MSETSNTLRLVLPVWDEYRASEPFSSDRWATSDRGWCFDSARADQEHNAIGNYLCYSNTHSHGPNGETIHACAYRMELAPLASTYTTFRRGSAWCAAIADAKAFIETAAALDANPFDHGFTRGVRS